MKLLLRCLAGLIGLLCVTSCSLEHDPRAALDDPRFEETADIILEHILLEDADGILELSYPLATEEQLEKFPAGLRDAFTYLPDAPDRFELFYSEVRIIPDQPDAPTGRALVYEIGGRDDTFAQVILVLFPHESECCFLTYIHINQFESPPSQIHDLSLKGKSVFHYIVGFLLIANPLFLLATAVFCLLNKKVKRKYLWIPFILVGLWGFDFNWSTGKFAFELINFENGMINIQFFSIHLLGAGIVKYGEFAPWIVSIGSPVGAVWYWVSARKGPASKMPEEF
ncbi:MAG: hypothetical protein CMK07_12455 [Ponticaulis sp.]|nr:hypothetical protein [Ponticaulis sp.]